MREDLTWLLGEEWYTAHRIRLWDAKKHTLKAFLVIQMWSKISIIQKFLLCDENNPINPRCGKISANFCKSPPHPPHPQFYPQKWWKFRDTSWLTKKNSITIDLRGAQVKKNSITIDLRGAQVNKVSPHGKCLFAASLCVAQAPPSGRQHGHIRVFRNQNSRILAQARFGMMLYRRFCV